jgi:hypothetical protein
MARMATDILRASGVLVARLYNPAGRSSIIGEGSERLRGRQENRVVVGRQGIGGASVMHGRQGSDALESV